MIIRNKFLLITLLFLISNFSFADITDGCSLPDSPTKGYVHLTSDGKVLYNTPVNISGFQFSLEGGNIVYNYILPTVTTGAGGTTTNEYPTGATGTYGPCTAALDTCWTGDYKLSSSGGDAGTAGQYQELSYNGIDLLQMISFSFTGQSIPTTSTANGGGCGTLLQLSSQTYPAGDVVDFSTLGFTGLTNLTFAGEAATGENFPPAIVMEYYEEVTGCMDDGSCTVAICGYNSPHSGQPACNYNELANVISTGSDCVYPQSYTTTTICDGCGTGNSAGTVVSTDNDNDGVCNNFDLCDNTPAGSTILTTTEANGCTDAQVLSIININSNLPNEFSISQNYPNPFNPITSISFTVDRTDEVSLIIYDLSGKEVANLVSGILTPATYKVDWGAVNNFGDAIASGMYVYRYKNSEQVITKKMLYLK